MRKSLFWFVGTIVLMVIMFSGCTSNPPRPGVNESEIVVQNNTANVLYVYASGTRRLRIQRNRQGSFIVPNGTHTIRVRTNAFRQAPQTLMVIGNSNRIALRVFSTSSQGQLGLGLTKIEGTPRVVLPVDTPPPSPLATPGIEAALRRAASETLQDVPQRSNIAIVFITAPDRSTADFIAGELEFIWFNQGYVLTDRRQLDLLRQEQHFHLSGEVDDATAVSIGRFVGADVIVTGSVDGAGDLRRLRLRAVNTETARIVGVASERF